MLLIGVLAVRHVFLLTTLHLLHLMVLLVLYHLRLHPLQVPHEAHLHDLLVSLSIPHAPLNRLRLLRIPILLPRLPPLRHLISKPPLGAPLLRHLLPGNLLTRLTFVWVHPLPPMLS